MTTPALSGLHHVMFPVTELDVATTWFESVFGARRIAELDHHDEHGTLIAVVLRVPGLAPMVLLRRNDTVPALSESALGVANSAELARWATHFDEQGVKHSEVMTGRVGDVLTCTMPGGPDLMLFTDRNTE
jgi:catechol 2,3-dioxygenase-like lactoylglutathione lyase family enzyme